MEEAQLQQGEGGTTPQDAAPPELAPTGPALATPVRWQLYYWPKMAGRGDFIRLMFAFKNIEYDDVANVEQNSSSVLRFYKGEADGFPVFAPPIIKKGDFVLSSTPVILEYLGKEFDMLPQDTMDAAHAMQLNLVVADYIAEGHDAFHPDKKTGSYDSQKERAKTQVKIFVEERLPRYLKYFESVLTRDKVKDRKFFFDDKCTYVDIAVYHALRATEFQFSGVWTRSQQHHQKLTDFKTMMENLDGIKKFLAEKKTQFCGNSMM